MYKELKSVSIQDCLKDTWALTETILESGENLIPYVINKTCRSFSRVLKCKHIHKYLRDGLTAGPEHSNENQISTSGLEKSSKKEFQIGLRCLLLKLYFSNNQLKSFETTPNISHFNGISHNWF